MAEGAQSAPVDLRYLKKAKFSSDQSDSTSAGVLSFLESIYTSIAENLPDVRDETWDADAEGVMDPYAGDGAFDIAMAPEQKKNNVKKHRRGVEVCPYRTAAAGCEPRWLPPGSMKDYWVQYKHGVTGRAASFATFWRDSSLLLSRCQKNEKGQGRKPFGAISFSLRAPFELQAFAHPRLGQATTASCASGRPARMLPAQNAQNTSF